MRRLDRSACAAITELMFVRDNPVRADYTIVLGISLWRSPLEAALRLFREGNAGTLVFTGGHNSKIGGSEAEFMLEEALARGVPPNMALCENRARHTRENLEFSWNMIAAKQANVHAVNIIGIHHHMPRVLLTARSVLPGMVLVGHVGYASIHFSPADWHASARGQRDVLNELTKLHSYYPEAVPCRLLGYSS
jgi:uncharacterized SAM-binding protein YcdF (DUF218 family)